MIDIKLKEKEEKRFLNGHQWIFSNEIDGLDRTAPQGELCNVFDSRGNKLGTGFFNPHSLIAVRMLQKGAEELADDFVFEKLYAAFNYRKELGLRKYGRMFYSETDGLPGLVVDRYGDTLVVDILTAGMERLKDDVTKALKKIYKPKCIFYRNDNHYRTLENLPLVPEVIGELPEELVIEENKVKYLVPIKEGQKTGFYYDQRDNREFLKPFFKDKLVMDLYSYVGSFGVLAALNGAAMVWGTDSSALAVEYANKNAELNGVKDICVYQRDDAERLLSANIKGELPEKPDFILLDPPPFVKNKKSLPQAIKLYVKLNRMALEGLEPGGYLATSTCSQHITRETFVDIIKQAAYHSKKKIAMVELRGQAKDHPILVGMPETDYLHFALVRVIE
ncbi:23S rRNA (cytosine1962-C5)-methyltransferase [Parelusimicrobium proximum]|uniref:class I SAM-dependent rRNA methyltransferase n=1 Tax=Parelusimicrobium proximum TaxID=3228953 RepID=UPI003D178C96